MTKVAKLVCISLMTRVIVEDTLTEEEVIEKARYNFKCILDDSLHENVESVEEDEECPYGSFKTDEIGGYPYYMG